MFSTYDDFEIIKSAGLYTFIFNYIRISCLMTKLHHQKLTHSRIKRQRDNARS